MQQVQFVDSHTGGEPTRVILQGGPPLAPDEPLAAAAQRLRREHDAFRRAVIDEPRGAEAVVGALLCAPRAAHCAAGVIFFNNVGYLGMCGHGAMGVAVTLAHLGRIAPGNHRLETPVGEVGFTYHGGSRVSVANVASRRTRRRAPLQLSGGRVFHADVAWGGNWFLLVEDHPERLTPEPENIARLTQLAGELRRAARDQGLRGDDGAELDHVELFGPPGDAPADSRNFVLCPGGAYDRSPCGTGTSAKLACLAADGKLAPGQIWRQASVIGSVFEASYQWLSDGSVAPQLTGDAFLTAEGHLLLDPRDPFCQGIPRRATGD